MAYQPLLFILYQILFSKYIIYVTIHRRPIPTILINQTTHGH